MTTLELRRVGRGVYRLGELGTLRAERRHGAAIEAGDQKWLLRRKVFGFGQIIVALDAGTGAQVASYVPRGFLHLRGIYGGELRLPGRTLGWRANHQLGRRFTVSEAGGAVITLEARAEPGPVTLESGDDPALAPIELLFCCHIAKQAVDTAAAGAIAGPASGVAH